MEDSLKRPGIRIKHNDLTHYFMRPHEDLPAAYLASCNKFFNELKRSSKNQLTSSQAVDIGIYKKEKNVN